MPLRFEADEKTIYLEGSCAIEEAEGLMGMLLGNPGVKLDLGGCDAFHTAFLQILMAGVAPVVRLPEEESLARMLEKVPGLLLNEEKG